MRRLRVAKEVYRGISMRRGAVPTETERRGPFVAFFTREEQEAIEAADHLARSTRDHCPPERVEMDLRSLARTGRLFQVD